MEIQEIQLNENLLVLIYFVDLLSVEFHLIKQFFNFESENKISTPSFEFPLNQRKIRGSLKIGIIIWTFSYK